MCVYIYHSVVVYIYDSTIFVQKYPFLTKLSTG